MAQFLAVAGGGAIGAVLRYYLSTTITVWFGPGFPAGTLVVNVLGSAAMGFGYVLFTERMLVSPELRLAVLVGFLGALTTFSTFSIETLGLLEGGAPMRAVANVFASVVLCLGACAAGMWLARVLEPASA